MTSSQKLTWTGLASPYLKWLAVSQRASGGRGTLWHLYRKDELLKMLAAECSKFALCTAAGVATCQYPALQPLQSACQQIFTPLFPFCFNPKVSLRLAPFVFLATVTQQMQSAHHAWALFWGHFNESWWKIVLTSQLALEVSGNYSLTGLVCWVVFLKLSHLLKDLFKLSLTCKTSEGPVHVAALWEQTKSLGWGNQKPWLG